MRGAEDVTQIKDSLKRKLHLNLCAAPGNPCSNSLAPDAEPPLLLNLCGARHRRHDNQLSSWSPGLA